MNISKYLIQQKGFGLLEVLIAVSVLSVGLITLARFHGVILQDGSYAKARSIATNLAQEKLDDLRSFSQLVAAGPGTFSYAEIANNLGGAEQGNGTLFIPSGNITVSSVAYTRNWNVVSYYYCGDNQAPSTTNCTANKPYPDFKTVAVNINWTDPSGTQSVQLQGTINASDPRMSAKTLTTQPPHDDPLVQYTPGSAPDVIPVPIDLGGNKLKESSKPIPDVSQQGASTLVSFDAVTYNPNDSNRTLSREEFFTVNCRCKFKPQTGPGMTPTRIVWENKTVAPKVGSKVTKTVGETLRTGPNGDNDQPAICDQCCNDHHDTNQLDSDGNPYPLYDPDRPILDYELNGNHKHYWYVNPSNPSLGLTPVTSGSYLEACRFKRVDGVLRLFPDWRLEKLNVLPYSYLLDSTNLQAYQNHVKDVVHHKIDASHPISTLAGRDFDTVPGATTQLIARAIYIEKMDAQHLSDLQQMISNGESWLEHVPFYELNLALLSNWTTANSAAATVTNEAIDTIVDPANNYYGSYSRGLVGGVAPGTALITSIARLGNTGVTGSDAIDPDDAVNTKSDSLTVTVLGSMATWDISGRITKGNNAQLNGITVTASNGGTCIVQGQSSERSYSCNVPNGWSGTITPASSGHYFVPASRSYSNVTDGRLDVDHFVIYKQ